MTSRITKMFSRKGSMRRPNISDLRDTVRSTIVSDGGYGSNEFIHKNFYEDDNYESIIKCLNGGYAVSSDLIDYMKDYLKLLKEIQDLLINYSNKWKSNLNSQSAISSYNTTKLAQRETLSSPEKHAQLIEKRRTAIQEVINKYERQVQEMYPRVGLNSHKHYRADVMKQLFKQARVPVKIAEDQLKDLNKQFKSVEKSLHEARIQQQNLQLNDTTSKNKQIDADIKVETKEKELQSTQDRLTEAEKTLKHERETYQGEAKNIYEQCRELEEERLNQIRQTLLDFINAIHSSDFSTEQDSLYEKLLADIESQQSTLNDLDFWARTYHVSIPQKSISRIEEHDEKDATQSTKKSPDSTRSVTESTEEDLSSADKTTTTTSTKPKPKKK